MLSQNGYGAITAYGDPALVSNPTIPGTDIKVLGGLRKGPVAEILLYTLGRINREVRAFRSQEQGFWGYNYRPIRGATQLSNHSSGTAADFLAADLPLGVEPDRVLTKTEIAALRRIAADLDGLVRFGAFYDGRKDVMHIEVIASESACAAYLAALGDGPTSQISTHEDEDDMTPDQSGKLDAVYKFLMEQQRPQGEGYSWSEANNNRLKDIQRILQGPDDRWDMLTQILSWMPALASDGKTASVDVDALADRLSKTLPAEVARALGERLVQS